MPAVMGKPSFENFSPKGKKFEKGKEGGTSGSGSEGGSGPSSDKVRTKKPGGKRSFLQRAKRFGKQGRLGKGTEVDSETYSYYVRILELLRVDDFDTDDNRDALVENSLIMAEGSEVAFSSNQLVSRVLENILPLATEDRIDSFSQAFTPSLRVIVADPFASHVLEKLLELTSSDKWRTSEKLTSWFEKTAKFVLNNFEDFTFDKYGSFVTKKVLECLSGHVERPNEDEIFSSKGGKGNILRSEVFGTRMRNTKWETTLQEFAKRFAAWPQFNDLGQRPETSRLLQNVIQTVGKTEKSEAIVKDLIVRVLAIVPETVQPDDGAHRILEVALEAADVKTYGVIYDKFYKGKLAQYVFGPCFTLTKIISAAPNQKYFSAVYGELSPIIKTLFEEGKTVLIHCLANQCAKLTIKQQDLWNSLKTGHKAIKKKSEDEKANLLMTLITIKPKTDDKPAAQKKFQSTYFGSAAVQTLIDFSNPVANEVLNCFNELEALEIVKLILDPKASYIVSKIFKSWTVPQKPKEELFAKLQGSFVELATTKFGSRIIDLIWLWANIPQKTTIATELSQRIPVLSANKYGRFIVETMGLQFLARNKKEWQEHITSQEKRKRDAEKIAIDLGLTTASPVSKDDSAKTPKKGKKRKSEEKAAEDALSPEVKKEEIESTETPKKKKKNRKSEAASEVPATPEVKNLNKNETPKKNKKNRKSEAASEVPVTPEVKNLDKNETPKKKKNRKSEAATEVPVTPEVKTVVKNETPQKNKNGKSEASSAVPVTPEVKNLDNKETPKKKKNRKSEATVAEVVEPKQEDEADVSMSKKSKKNKRKSQLADESLEAVDLEETIVESTPTPKKKKKSERNSNDDSMEIFFDANSEVDDTPKKKKKNRKSEKTEEDSVPAEEEQTDTPKKQKKKDRKSKQF